MADIGLGGLGGLVGLVGMGGLVGMAVNGVSFALGFNSLIFMICQSN